MAGAHVSEQRLDPNDGAEPVEEPVEQPAMPYIPDLPEPPPFPVLLNTPVRKPTERNILGMGEKPTALGRASQLAGMGKAWGLATEFVASIIGSFLIGFAIDTFFKTTPTWTLIMIGVGLTYAVWRIMRRTMEEEKREKAEKANAKSPR
jgi:F0F1-type ATP synthase assembly protein I